ncbi:MAG: DUF1826 domain-containing protein [Pseudomonadota bacterium]
MPSLCISDAAQGLASIAAPHCAAAIWRRQPLLKFQAWIDGLSPDQLPRTRVIRRPDEIRDAAREACEASGTPDEPERALLIEDTVALAELFTDVMRAPYLRLRYDVITTNACRRFHVDAVTARLICTYRGTGTQYGIAEEGADPEQIHTAPTGAPILLRGTLWPETPRSGLLHRSPPIEGTSETRLLLVLDPMTGPTEEDRCLETVDVPA